jgi:hypothetical protein
LVHRSHNATLIHKRLPIAGPTRAASQIAPKQEVKDVKAAWLTTLTLILGLSAYGVIDVASLHAPSVPFRIMQADNTFFKASVKPEEDAIDMAIFRSQADLDAFLAKHPVTPHFDDSGRSVGWTLPAQDFDKEQGIAILTGTQPTGSEAVRITSIEGRTDDFLVHSLLRHPGPGVGAPAVLSRPFVYVAMGRSEKPIRFAPLVER